MYNSINSIENFATSSCSSAVAKGSLLILRDQAWTEHLASTSLESQLVQAVIPPQHDASAEKDPPAVLSSIHSPTLDSV